MWLGGEILFDIESPLLFPISGWIIIIIKSFVAMKIHTRKGTFPQSLNEQKNINKLDIDYYIIKSQTIQHYGVGALRL